MDVEKTRRSFPNAAQPNWILFLASFSKLFLPNCKICPSLCEIPWETHGCEPRAALFAKNHAYTIQIRLTGSLYDLAMSCMTTMVTREKTDTISFEEALDRTGNGLYNYLLLATCSLVLLAIGVDLFGFSLVVTAACDLQLSVSEKGILTSIPFVGILMTSFAWGYVSDTRGRRCALVVPLLVSFVLSCVSSLAPHWLFLGLMKFLSVCFSCAANSATYTLLGESCIQRVRSKYMLLITCLIILSPAAAAVITYPILKLSFSFPLPWLGISFSPWRLLSVLLAVPVGLGALALHCFEESPKFLFSRGRNGEAVAVLTKIYRVNHRGSHEAYEVPTISCEEIAGQKAMSLPRAMFELTSCLFRGPYLWRSLQLYYIVAVVYITNNSFLVWLPHIMNLVRVSMEHGTGGGGVCALISIDTKYATENVTAPTTVTPDICLGTIKDNVIFTLIASQSIFSFLNFVISCLPHRKKAVLISTLCTSALSGVCINLIPEAVGSVVAFMMFTCTCLGMGIVASYCVELYPTSYRGMAACLSIMVGRSCAFLGINLVASTLFDHCHITFYLWSLLVLSSAAVAGLLPADGPPTLAPARARVHETKL